VSWKLKFASQLVVRRENQNFISKHGNFFHADSDTIGFCLPNSWGSWINIDRPSGNGDFEVLADHKRRSRDACESPIGMQIRLASGGSFTRGRDAVRNSLAYGASCTNQDQSDRSCNDYKVRYCCLQFGPVPGRMLMCLFVKTNACLSV